MRKRKKNVLQYLAAASAKIRTQAKTNEQCNNKKA